MTREEVIRMAREAGCVKEGWLEENCRFLQRFAELVAAKETEARKAAQLETIALREDLTKRAMQAEKEAYQRGVRDEREALKSICEELKQHYSDYAATALLNGDVDLSNAASGEPRACRAMIDAIRARNNQGNQQ